MYDYDLFVIGAGSGGVRAARMSAGFGAKVGIAEDSRLGGTCVNVGCVPKKLLVYASHAGEELEDAAAYGWTVEGVAFDWSRLIANKDKEIARLNGVYRRLLEGAGVDLFEARASLIDAHTLQVGERRVGADRILIATGGWPSLPEIPGIEHAVTSNEAFHFDHLPARIAVVGGGYIAVEFAGIFNGMGAQVTQLYRGEQILRGFDDDLRHILAGEMRKKGVDLRVATNVSRIEKTGDELLLTLADDTALAVDCVMYATGRLPNTSGLNLADLGVALDDKGAIVVDDYSKSSVDNIFAIGDVTNRINLTPVAIMEGMALARHRRRCPARWHRCPHRGRNRRRNRRCRPHAARWHHRGSAGSRCRRRSHRRQIRRRRPRHRSHPVRGSHRQHRDRPDSPHSR